MIIFRWKSSYMGCIDYEVVGDGPDPYRVSLRHEAGAYERSIFNGTDADWQREIVSSLHGLHRKDGQRLSAEVVRGFNEWRLSEHHAFLKKLLANPARYGAIDVRDPERSPPTDIPGIHFDPVNGWVRT